ncbi:MAG: hypothetical protein ACPGZU_09155 [Ketobacter sp.]|jgi:peptidylamidoglycolate lyase
MNSCQRIYGKSMEIAGNAYIVGIQLLSQIKWIRTPRNNSEILGQGQFRFRINRRWFKENPTDFPVKNCHEMVIDRQQRLYLLTDHPNNNVIVISLDGEVLNSWTLNSTGAHGLTIAQDKDGECLWICDPYNPRVIKASLDGRLLGILPNPYDIGEYTATMPYAPTQTAVSSDGDIYVADGYGSQYVLQFDAQGNFIRRFGGKGHAPWNLNFAHGIAIDTRTPSHPLLLVTSRKDCCIKRFTLDGQYLDRINLPGGYPCRPVIHGDHLFISLCWSGSHLRPNSGFLVVLDKNNQVCETLGGTAELDSDGNLVSLESDYACFCHVHDVCVDSMGNLYVCQWNAGKIPPYRLEKI